MKRSKRIQENTKNKHINTSITDQESLHSVLSHRTPTWTFFATLFFWVSVENKKNNKNNRNNQITEITKGKRSCTFGNVAVASVVNQMIPGSN